LYGFQLHNKHRAPPGSWIVIYAAEIKQKIKRKFSFGVKKQPGMSTAVEIPLRDTDEVRKISTID
jgi:hypothetical protein